MRLKQCARRATMLPAIMLFIGSLVLPSGVYALDPHRLPSQYLREVWNSDNGLPSSLIMAIAQTPDHYLWLGTFSGLVRFDGVRFTVFNTANTAALANNTIWTLLTDKQGTLWIGTNGGGLVRYDGRAFTRFTTKDGLPADVVRSIGEDASGTIWVGTVAGLCSLNVSARERVSNRVSASTTDSRSFNAVALAANGGAEPFINALCGTDEGMWVGTEGLGAFYLSKGKQLHQGRENGLPTDAVNEICRDRDGNVWLGTSRGYCVLRVRGESIILAEKGLLENSVRRIRQDRDGNVWLATTGGLFRLTNGVVSGFPPEHDLAKSNLNTVMEDADGNVWIGTYTSQGLMCLRNGAFVPFGVSEGLPGDVVFGVVEGQGAAQSTSGSQGKTLWFACYGGIARLERPSGIVTRFMPGGAEKQQAVGNLVRALVRRRDGSVWAATYGAGVFRFNGTSFVSALSTKNGLSNDAVRALHEDVNGTLWSGTRNGLTSMTADGALRTYTTQDGLPNNSIMNLFEDSGGGLWIATDGGGVLRMQGDSKVLYSVKNGLAADVVFTVREDVSPSSSGAIWIGTNSGLTRIKNNRLTSIRAKDGLPNENVYQIVSDGRGTIWIGSAVGIFCVDEKQLNALMDAKEAGQTAPLDYKMFGKSDGMRAVDCTVPVQIYKTEAGIWFPTLKGALFLDATHHASAPVPPVYIQSMVYDGVSAALDTALTIPAGARQFSIDYTALCFDGIDKVRFRYRLLGIDNDWFDAGQRRTAYYTNLPPGDYTFRVMSSTADGVWIEKGATLHFRVASHFWQTYPFYALCVVALLLAGWGANRYQVLRVHRRNALLKRLVEERTSQLSEANRELEVINQEVFRQNEILSTQAAEIEIIGAGLQEKNLILEELNTEKNEFLGIAAHDLKNPLTQIVMMTSMLQKYFRRLSEEQVTEKLQSIEVGARRMTDIIENLLDVHRIESGALVLHNEKCSMNEATQKIVKTHIERASAKNIALHFEPSSDTPAVTGDMIVLEEVLDNLISNAIKYSPHGKNVVVRVKSSSDAVRIEVQDEGPGLTEEDKAKLFGKFARLSAQPTGGEHSTGLGLSIVKKMVEAMNGRVWCESEIGKGATFIVELPKASER